jgi:hypothetical protein
MLRLRSLANQMLRCSEPQTGRLKCSLVDSETQMLGDTDAQGYVHLEAQMPRLRDLDALEIQRLRDSYTWQLRLRGSDARMLTDTRKLRLGYSEAQRLRGLEAQMHRCSDSDIHAQRLGRLEDQRLGGSEAQVLRCSDSDTQTWMLRDSDA